MGNRIALAVQQRAFFVPVHWLLCYLSAPDAQRQASYSLGNHLFALFLLQMRRYLLAASRGHCDRGFQSGALDGAVENPRRKNSFIGG